MLLINSSLPNGVCYIETKNLDGESNLKHKQAAKECLKYTVDDQSAIINFQSASIECEQPNEFLYTFNGQLTINKDIVAIDKDQILLRGSSLKNTKWVYGVAIYTGHDSKIMKNSSQSKAKKSKLEISTNKYLMQAFFIQTIVCFTGAIFSTIWDRIMC